MGVNNNIDINKFKQEWNAWGEMADKDAGNSVEYKDGVKFNSAFEKQFVLNKAREKGYTDEQIRQALGTADFEDVTLALIGKSESDREDIRNAKLIINELRTKYTDAQIQNAVSKKETAVLEDMLSMLKVKFPEANIKSFDIADSIDVITNNRNSFINEIFEADLYNADMNKQAVPNLGKKASYEKEDLAFDWIHKHGVEYFKGDNAPDIKGFANGLKNYLLSIYGQSPSTRNYMSKLAAEVAQLFNKIDDIPKASSYNSRNDIEALYDLISDKVKIDNNDPLAKFKDAMIKEFVIQAEKHQKTKENDRIVTRFKELREEKTKEKAVKKMIEKYPGLDAMYTKLVDEGKKPLDAIDVVYNNIKKDIDLMREVTQLSTQYSREDAVKLIKKEFKGSYYEGHSHLEYADKFGGKATKKLHYDGLISQMEKGTVLEDAREEVWNAVWAQKGNPNLTKSRQVENAAKKLIHNDEYTAKIMRGELSFKEKISWERSVYKDFRKAVATYNNVENIKQKWFTADELYDVLEHETLLKKDNKGKWKHLTQLVSAGLIKEQNGKYNISALSDLIKEQISPADMRANYQTKALNKYGEIQAVVDKIKEKTKIGDDFDYREACMLIDACGFQRDKWTFGYALRKLQDAGLKTARDAIGNAVAILRVGAKAGDPTAHVVNNLAEVNKALLSMHKGVTIDPDNPVNIDINIKITTTVNGETVPFTGDFNEDEILSQFYDAGWIPNVDCGVSGNAQDGWSLWFKKKSDDPYEDQRLIASILGEDFDLKDGTGVKFEEEAVIDDKGKPETTNKWQAFRDATMIDAAFNILGAVLSEMKGELPVINTIVDDHTEKQNKIPGLPVHITAKSHEGYIRSLSNLNPKVKAAISNVALLYCKKDENGNFLKDKNGETILDAQKFETLLKTFAGPKSFLNKSELINGLFAYRKDHGLNAEFKPDKKPDIPAIPDVTKENKFGIETPTITQVETTQKQPCTPHVIERTQPHIIRAGDSWDLILDSYYPGIPKEKRAQARRALKRANGIKLNDTNLRGKLELPEELMGFKRNANMNQEEYDKINSTKRKKNWNNRAWRNGTGVGGRGKAKASKTVDDCKSNSPRVIYEGDPDYDKYN